MTASRTSHRNNFDLIRLAAAAQVVIVHCIENAGGNATSPIRDFLDRFPGVPIFFVVSGFLVAQSFERSAGLGDYAVKRALRIYPGLYLCLLLSILSVVAVGFLPPSALASLPFGEWLLAQLTVFQFLRLPLLDHYASGTLNGSLWTIPIELQFYAALPLLYWALRRTRHVTAVLGGLIAIFMVANVYRYNADIDLINTLQARLLKVSLLPYLYMFLVGMLIHLNFERLRPLFAGKFLYWLVGYLATSYAMSALGFRGLANGIGIANVLVMAGLVLSAAYTRPELAEKTLRGNDISYGIYIYHMPILNVMMYFAVGGSAWVQSAITCVLTILFATASWLVVEKPAIALKRKRVRPSTLPTETSAAGK